MQSFSESCGKSTFRYDWKNRKYSQQRSWKFGSKWQFSNFLSHDGVLKRGHVSGRELLADGPWITSVYTDCRGGNKLRADIGVSEVTPNVKDFDVTPFRFTEPDQTCFHFAFTVPWRWSGVLFENLLLWTELWRNPRCVRHSRKLYQCMKKRKERVSFHWNQLPECETAEPPAGAPVS